MKKIQLPVFLFFLILIFLFACKNDYRRMYSRQCGGDYFLIFRNSSTIFEYPCKDIVSVNKIGIDRYFGGSDTFSMQIRFAVMDERFRSYEGGFGVVIDTIVQHYQVEKMDYSFHEFNLFISELNRFRDANNTWMEEINGVWVYCLNDSISFIYLPGYQIKVYNSSLDKQRFGYNDCYYDNLRISNAH